ncbi:MAG: hypothetical protein JRD68_06985, partial [Deltaproteobacteria bacterium]|nr:hypothetical protein [Deltaproteobacteria bacterium]
MKLKSFFSRGGAFTLLFLLVWIHPGAQSIGTVSRENVRTSHPQTIIKKILPLQVPFIANEGQLDKSVSFYARTFSGTVYVTTRGDMVYSLVKSGNNPASNTETLRRKRNRVKYYVLKERLLGAKTIHPRGREKAVTRINYFKGRKSSGWKTDLPSYQQVDFGQVYDRIDLTLKAHGNNVEKIFTVHPRGRVDKIRLNIEGAASMAVNPDGQMVVMTGLGPIKFSAPVAYQDIKGKREYVKTAYVVTGTSYGFRTGKFNRAYPLVIDPLLESTFLGGSGWDVAESMVLDQDGNVFITGGTDSANFPVTVGGPFQGTDDVFVSKLSSDLSTILASTYLGGSGEDGGSGIILNISGDVFVVGEAGSSGTDISDFPTTSGVFDETYNGGSEDVFVARFDRDSLTLLASTFLGGSLGDIGLSIALYGPGHVYLAGWTEAANFPTTSGAYDETYNGGGDVFVSKLTNDLTALPGSTFIGGSSEEPGYGMGVSIGLDSAGSVFIAGEGESFDYPTTAGAYDETYNSGEGNVDDVFVSKFSNDLTNLLASTFIGGSDREGAWGMAIDGNDNIFVTGRSYSANYPTTEGLTPCQGVSLGSADAFISKLPNDLSALSASTCIGGSLYDSAEDMVIDRFGNPVITGGTASSDYPTSVNAFDRTYNGGSYDVMVSKLTNDLSSILASTLIGGNGYDYGLGVSVNGWGLIFISGSTESSDFPTPPGAADSTYNGGEDVFVSRITRDLASLIPDSASITLPPGDQVADYQILSMPLALSPEFPFGDQIGIYDDRLMRIAGWNPYTQSPDEYPFDMDHEPRPGNAAWMLFRYGKTLAFTGFKTPDIFGPVMGDFGYFQPLEQNWNMVGNPYNYPVSIASLVIVRDVVEVPLTDPGNNITQQVFWVWNNGAYAPATTLAVGQGGWIKLNSGDAVVFFPANQGRS